jgi:hypothetical protein
MVKIDPDVKTLEFFPDASGASDFDELSVTPGSPSDPIPYGLFVRKRARPLAADASLESLQWLL